MSGNDGLASYSTHTPCIDRVCHTFFHPSLDLSCLVAAAAPLSSNQSCLCFFYLLPDSCLCSCRRATVIAAKACTLAGARMDEPRAEIPQDDTEMEIESQARLFMEQASSGAGDEVRRTSLDRAHTMPVSSYEEGHKVLQVRNRRCTISWIDGILTNPLISATCLAGLPSAPPGERSSSQ